MGLLLLMVRPNLDGLPPLALPEGYRLATAAEFDKPAPLWAAVINESFDDQSWTEEYVHESFASKEQHDPEGVFFIMRGAEAVSTAFAWLDDPGERQDGRVHWVGTSPEHRGKGLGTAVVVAVLHYFKQHGFEKAHLETHPPLLPAIRVYLSLGFEPVPRKHEEETAWAEVMERIGDTRENSEARIQNSE